MLHIYGIFGIFFVHMVVATHSLMSDTSYGKFSPEIPSYAWKIPWERIFGTTLLHMFLANIPIEFTLVWCNLVFVDRTIACNNLLFWGDIAISLLINCLMIIIAKILYLTLREQCPNKGFFWSVFSCIWSRKNTVFGHFSRSVVMAVYGNAFNTV